MDFIKTVLATDSSYEALLFMEHFAANSPLLVDSKGVRQPLQHCYNGSEKTVENWRVDGYSIVDGKPVFVEFLGCHWHGCIECGSLANDEDNDEVFMRRMRSEKLKYAHLRKLGRLVLQRECLWVERRKKIDYFETSMPRVWSRRENHAQLLEGIKSGQLFGFAKTTVKSPRWITEAQRMTGFFYPIIPTKIMLKKEYYNTMIGEDLPKDPVLTQIFDTVEPILLHSKVIEFYIELGCEIQIHEFVQYKGERCFKPFVDRVVGLRMDAKRQGNQPMNITAKLCGNSSYGKTLGKFLI